LGAKTDLNDFNGLAILQIVDLRSYRRCSNQMTDPFSPQLMRLIHTEPSILNLAASKALELWALLGAARAEADARRDDSLSVHLSLISAALTLPDDPDT